MAGFHAIPLALPTVPLVVDELPLSISRLSSPANPILQILPQILISQCPRAFITCKSIYIYILSTFQNFYQDEIGKLFVLIQPRHAHDLPFRTVIPSCHPRAAIPHTERGNVRAVSCAQALSHAHTVSPCSEHEPPHALRSWEGCLPPSQSPGLPATSRRNSATHHMNNCTMKGARRGASRARAPEASDRTTCREQRHPRYVAHQEATQGRQAPHCTAHSFFLP